MVSEKAQWRKGDPPLPGMVELGFRGLPREEPGNRVYVADVECGNGYCSGTVVCDGDWVRIKRRPMADDE